MGKPRDAGRRREGGAPARRRRRRSGRGAATPVHSAHRRRQHIARGVCEPLDRLEPKNGCASLGEGKRGMYINIFGGSALLHLLLGHPRLILVLGIAGTVAVTSTPHGPGRYLGTSQYLEKLDAAIEQSAEHQAAEVAARQAVRDMLEAYDPIRIENVVAETLRECGPGCTDLSTPIVIRDPELLRRVLTLHELDRTSAPARPATVGPKPAPAGIGE